MIENFIKHDEEYSIQVIITDKNGITDPEVNAKATEIFKELLNELAKQQIK
jgi:hypothetical protein